jgi:Condensation domain
VPDPGRSRADLAARLAELSPEARALVAQRLQSRRTQPGMTIPRRDPGEAVPLSSAQWRLWFMEQLRPGTNAWNTPVAARLRGPLDVDALRAALVTLVARHATLRTIFEAPGGVPAPVLLSNPAVDVPVLELTAGEDERDGIDRFVADEVATPFDLAADLMIRARLLRLGAEDHALVLVAHHIACDGWSKGLLVSELGTAYDAWSAGATPGLRELPIEYSDFAAWQRDRLTGENLERLNAYWRGRLDGHAPALLLPTDRPRPTRQAFGGAVHWLKVPGPLAERTRALGRQERATPFMTLLAAFNALLFARSGQLDVLVGSPAAMRTHPELEHLVGLFANTLVYRTSLAGRPNFRELIGRVRETALGVYAHQELPFEKIVEVTKPRRDPSRNPLVQVNLRVEGREPVLSLRDLDVVPIPLDPGIARFDLAIELGETDDGYDGYLEYDTALFDAESAAGYASDFVAILEEATQKPGTALPELAAVRAAGLGGRRAG